MNFKDWLFTEMPIANLEKLGQWGPNAKRAYGYNRQDVGILDNSKAIEKIKKSWRNSKNDWDIYFLRSYKASQHIEVGEVSSDWVKTNLEIDIQPKEDTITVIFTQNRATPHEPMTAWILAHRMGHAIKRGKEFEQYFSKTINKDFKEILKEVYNIETSQFANYGYDYYKPQNTDKYLKALALAVGTMRSARERNLRNFNEFYYELIAQYIITGQIKFNPLPKSLILDKKMAWGRPNYTTKYSRLSEEELQEWNNVLEGHADTYEYYLDSIFSSLEGKIFVM